jgi:hypothetical protein
MLKNAKKLLMFTAIFWGRTKYLCLVSCMVTRRLAALWNIACDLRLIRVMPLASTWCAGRVWCIDVGARGVRGCNNAFYSIPTLNHTHTREIYTGVCNRKCWLLCCSAYKSQTHIARRALFHNSTNSHKVLFSWSQAELWPSINSYQMYGRLHTHTTFCDKCRECVFGSGVISSAPVAEITSFAFSCTAFDK